MIKDVEQYIDSYQKERAERFGVYQTAIWQALKKMELTYKNATLSESQRKRSANVSTKKQQYEEDKPIVLLIKVVFIRYPTRTYGYSSKGQRCFGLKNWGAKGRTNIIWALLGTMLFAIGLFDSYINSIFYAWVTQVLIPVLPKTV